MFARSARVSEAAPPASTLSAGGEGTVESGLGWVCWLFPKLDLRGSYMGIGEDSEDGSIAMDHDLARLRGCVVSRNFEALISEIVFFRIFFFFSDPFGREHNFQLDFPW